MFLYFGLVNFCNKLWFYDVVVSFSIERLKLCVTCLKAFTYIVIGSISCICIPCTNIRFCKKM